ncbi:ABC transporter substrate-binding protein [Natrialba swarupiae]|uniref:ABC transporter substrate-binding protein n=1 Tax=Natrialba swarupiae TaxID=2448032 RepID=A0A5D5AG91_9EURY|nr:ABC transporter substrate-binding protein [Natrialba swarupiae]TYT60776.1 ABC transporter substrate-binding protein [Natrialba swarupiae]
MNGERLSRRQSLSAITTAGIGAVAGCVGGTEESDETDDADGSHGGDEHSDEPVAETESAVDTPYEVCMDPMGCQEFDAVPETWVTNDGTYADIGVALDVTDGLEGLGEPHRYYTGYYDELPGVSLEKEDLPELAPDRSADRELFYELDVDLHVIDPKRMEHTFGLDEDDVEELEENVAPFFASYMRHRNDEWQQDYEYYDLFEGFERMAAVFRRQERFEQFRAFYDEFLADIQSRIPEEGPEVLIVRALGDEPEEFFPRYIDDEANFVKRWRDLNVRDNLEGSGIPEWGTRLDYETLADLDPEIIVAEGQHDDDITLDEERFENVLVSYMQSHPLADSITAVREGRVYPGGINYEGPITLLFQTEIAAKQVYPEEFTEDDLFDREELAAIITGDA